MTKVVIEGMEYEETEGLSCPECGSRLRLLEGEHGLRYGPVPPCGRERCPGSVGAHPGGRALGSPADARTKKARIDAHDAFDRIWRHGFMRRRDAYAWMRRKMAITAAQAHIGEFDEARCADLVRLVKEAFPSLFPFDE